MKGFKENDYMKMIFRWFPGGDDSVTLEQIKQIPGVTGVAAMLSDIPVGEVWPIDRLEALKNEIQSAGLELEVIESVNIHEDIKKGLPTRDKYIKNYIKTIENLSTIGVKCLCYNFMPVMDWLRSELAYPLEDGSNVLAYNHETVLKMNPALIAEEMLGNSRGYSLPGWEPERLEAMAADINFYKKMSDEQYWENTKYFLDQVIPYAEKYDVKMAIHPDDPPFSIYGLPKLINNVENIRKFLNLNSSPYNGLTLCTGSLGGDMENDIPQIISEFASQGRIHFAHIRNVKHLDKMVFTESAHYSPCGDLDMYKVVKAFYENRFDGYIRPDHGRMIWGEQARPGYGLYDRALGASYILGLWEAIDKNAQIE
ncbi:mannonate dehydratase [Anaeromicropila populeti]|uniref:Mannonate dehydratase n=1 Tax=Anaeromicropila populeti TaxID=37658 RepID=A0A1I6JHB8_9FIRM|nr:mannonate dehydratase [Anaeromicropila populeti]SFR78376.1 D-mannonate dehydratase [Anaeromicropila populeti]